MRIEGSHLVITESLLDRTTVPELYGDVKGAGEASFSAVDLSNLQSIDSAGAAFLETLRKEQGKKPEEFYQSPNEQVARTLELFALPEEDRSGRRRGGNLFVWLGGRAYRYFDEMKSFLIIAANIFIWSATDIVRTRYRRRGEVSKQANQIGIDAVPIVGLLSLIIGLILALQSASQLRQFGAGIFVVDLIAISMVREMGPMITSILIAGRSGSAIAAEIATMKVTEELDALKIMALEPVRFVIVPKALAISFCLPLLVGISIIVGIAAGMIVSFLYLDISLLTFTNQVFEVLKVNDLTVGLGKSFFFGWVIIFVSSYYGLSTSGGAEGVGSATTKSVVGSIFGVIALDALFSFSYLA